MCSNLVYLASHSYPVGWICASQVRLTIAYGCYLFIVEGSSSSALQIIVWSFIACWSFRGYDQSNFYFCKFPDPKLYCLYFILRVFQVVATKCDPHPALLCLLIKCQMHLKSFIYFRWTELVQMKMPRWHPIQQNWVIQRQQRRIERLKSIRWKGVQLQVQTLRR